jgi:hypothetical protein
MMDARMALDELDRVGLAVRLRSRWYGHFLMVLGAGTAGYFAAVNLAVPATPADIAALTLGWTGFVVLLGGWARRQPVVWRGIQRLRPPVMVAYSVLVAMTILLNVTVLRELPARWALGAIPAMPCLVGAWLVLRRGAVR